MHAIASTVMSDKRNNLPRRPALPSYEHMLEDLDNAPADDVVFDIENNLYTKETLGLKITSNTMVIYNKVKGYLKTKQQLSQLKCALRKEEQQLQANNEEIRRLANDIKKQAQAALIT